MFGETVQVRVGQVPPEVETFTLHRGILRHYSGYFDAALKDGFKEGQTGIIELPDEDALLFKRFVFWLYTGVFERPQAQDNFHDIVRMWVFADMRQVPLLANLMIDSARDETVEKWKMITSELRFVYENTPPESRLRRFMIWAISNFATSKALEHIPQAAWHQDATFDILKAVWSMKEQGTVSLKKEDFAKINTCQWHQHEDGVTCPDPAASM